MDKVTSFLLIVIIVYVSYDYCSNPVIEGQGNVGGYNTKAHDAVKSAPACSPPYTCSYNGVSCDLTDGDKNSWHFGDSSHAPAAKSNCMRCIQSSDTVSATQRALAGIGLETNKDNHSEFAYNLCDAKAAGCDSAIWYANAHSDWDSQDCKGVDLTSKHSHSTIMMCTLLKNPVLQFFMSFLGGVTCTLKIKALELEQTITHAMDDMENSMKCASCKCGGILGHDKCDAAWKCCGES